MKYRYLNQVLDSGYLTSYDFNGGKFVKKLEHQIRQYTKAKYAIACNSGTSALYISILARGFKKKRIAFPNFTFKATKNAILATQNIPVPFDVTLDNMTISTKIKNVDCIIPVHLYGHVAYMHELKELGLPMIEDCCQSLGSKLNQTHTGMFGDTGCFSFYPSKIISAGEGGMIITNNKSIADKCKLIRNHGNDKIWGLNLRMSEIHASIATEHMENISEILYKRKKNTDILHEKLKDYTRYHPRKGEIRNNGIFTITTSHRSKLMKQYPLSRVYYSYTLGKGKNGDWLSKNVLSFSTDKGNTS